MNVNVVGFQMSFARRINIPELYQLLESSSGKKLRQGSTSYLYYTDLKEGYIIGLVLRFKEDKKSIATSKEGEEFIIDKTELGKGKESTEVSLFAINPETCRGVYYSYIGSLSSSILKTIWKKPHDKLKTYNIKSLIDEYSQHGKKDKAAAHKRATDDCSGLFNLELLTNPADIDDLIKHYDTINALEINSVNAFNDAGRYRPDAQFIKRGKINQTFENVVSNESKIVAYIKGLIANKSDDDIVKLRGKLEGTSEDKWLVVGENIQDFGRLKFDSFVDLLPEHKWSDYSSCEAIEKLLYILTNKTAIFGDLPADEAWRLESAQTINKKETVE
ncbi:hypothetical protein Q4493_12660 [Colwellia sp. 1_MG-2023]|uniref:hypothetical protein n=1 Tax=Colwellia sp. 1_MG-2023 TaxID=3062649 RepID=UPI0026E462EE|nr:hypothetical protein [Colwellia sp. 1_MG-2023]MDO6446628.1 hypothetical protein [Colwellia sp. 1_MG-2023]